MVERFLDWLAGNGKYHTLLECLGGDLLVTLLVVFLSVSVAIGYVLIARAWFRISKQMKDESAKRSFNTLMWIFLYCSVCGYLWHPLQLFWPGWKLYVALLAILTFFTWRFILTEKSTENIGKYFRDKEQLKEDLLTLGLKTRALEEQLHGNDPATRK